MKKSSIVVVRNSLLIYDYVGGREDVNPDLDEVRSSRILCSPGLWPQVGYLWRLVSYWFAVPDGAVAREGVALEQYVCRESGKHIVGDWQLGAHRFFWASSMLMINWATRGSAYYSLWRLRMSSTPAGWSRTKPSFSRWSRIVWTGTRCKTSR